tara:strand:+ start:682 stop:1035 length:354 start_codon:yes stop_codon:yes gene_type:complete
MADKKTTKTSSGAQQYVRGSNSDLNGDKSRASIKRARQAIEDSDLSPRQKSKAGSLIQAASNANMSKIITSIAGSNNSSVRLFNSLEKGWEELAKKNDKLFITSGMSKGGLAKKKKK